MKIPFGGSRVQNLHGVDANPFKDHREFIHKGNVEIPLAILDNLGSFRNLYAGCQKCPG